MDRLCSRWGGAVIRVGKVPEPDGFAAERERGEAHMRAYPSRGPIDIWSPFRSHLAAGFEHRCGYTAMLTYDGQVDHYRCQRDRRHMTYDWSNYRYCSVAMNRRKGTKDVLDPYEIETRWFEIQFPSLQLVLTDTVPENERVRAARTIACLGLGDDEFIIKQRQGWIEMYGLGRLNLEGLRQVAPLLAEMVERRGLTPQEVGRVFSLGEP